METKNKSQILTWTLAGFSFVADAIAIIQVLNVESFATSKFLSPGLAFALWILGIYTYVAFLHSIWTKRNEVERNKKPFRKWLYNLLINFEEPKILFPSVLFLILLFFIAGAVSYALLPFLTIGVLFLLLLLIGTKWEATLSSKVEELDDEQKEKILAEWDFWENRIQAEFETKAWVTLGDFKDLTITKQLSFKSLEYIFATFVSKHPKRYRYGRIIDIEKAKTVQFLFEATVVFNALVDLDSLSDKYYVD